MRKRIEDINSDGQIFYLPPVEDKVREALDEIHQEGKRVARTNKYKLFSSEKYGPSPFKSYLEKLPSQ